MIDKNKLRLVGIIAAAHGIKGDAIIYSYTQPTINILSLPTVDQNNVLIKLKFVRKNTKGHLICKINDSTTRTYINSIAKTQLFCSKDHFPQLGENEFYNEDLKNLKVLNPDFESLGSIFGLYNFGAGDIIEVKFNDGTNELFPFTTEFFPIVNTNYVILTKKLGF